MQQQQHGHMAIVAVPAVPPPPALQIGRDEAICFFRDRFAWQTVSRFFVLSTRESPALLLNMVAALGLASFSFARKSPALRRAAAAEYGAALEGVNRMLSDPGTATSDSTLAVVILMSFFETLTGHSPPSTKSWTNHASGAAGIIALRGPAQLDTATGRQLLREVKGLMLATSLIHKVPLSQALVHYTHLAMARNTPSENHGERIFLITAEVANLRASLQDAATTTTPAGGEPMTNTTTTTTTTTTASVFDAVDELTARLHAWRLATPPDWQYRAVQLDDDDDDELLSDGGGAETWYGSIRPVGGRCLVYSADHVVVGWSNYRMSCILLAELLLGLLRRRVLADTPTAPSSSSSSSSFIHPSSSSSSSIHSSPHYTSSSSPSSSSSSTAAALAKCRALRRTMDQLAVDTCATVPYLLGLKCLAVAPDPDGGGGGGGALPDLCGAYMILMPLWVAACVEGPGHPLRRNAMFLLEVVARRVGIRHASLQRHFLVSLEGMAEWMDRLPPTR
ncbi:hypothetical protein JDV02_002048 [Purpureocillium takamizusanense]|nr:uncharacterized protein JDV02_002048 [Purpureocillium takamizusanense]UNI15521.1 hypothetical protein JDV02_002048 [Purpureocillium takamizusanense]